MNPQQYIQFKNAGKIISTVYVSPSTYKVTYTVYDTFGTAFQREVNFNTDTLNTNLSVAQSSVNSIQTLLTDLEAISLPTPVEPVTPTPAPTGN